MNLPLPVRIGLRYTRSPRRNQFISFIALIAMVGLALGVMTLVVVLAVMNGFEKELHARILGIAGHATIFNRERIETIHDGLLEKVKQAPAVIAAAPFIRSAAMVSNGERVHGVVVYGIEPQVELQVTDLGAAMQNGRGTLTDLTADGARIIIGQALADKLKIKIGESLTLIAPQPGATPEQIVPQLARYTLTGTFHAGMYEYDSSLVILHRTDAAALFNMGEGISGVRARFADPLAAPQLKQAVLQSLGGQYAIVDWTEFYGNFFKALKSQKAMMFLIVSLIILVAAFNIVSTLVMAVIDKQADIGILRTLGLRTGQVLGVFMTQGLVIGLCGTLLGGAGGYYLAHHIGDLAKWLEHNLHITFLPADVYYLSTVPAAMRMTDLLLVCVTAFVLCLLATLYPARRAARVQPAEALRYE